MIVHLIDGTYELFRHYYGVPKQKNTKGQEVAAARAVVGSMLSLLEQGATHIAIATDHVIESFRNELWSDYKDGTGIEPDLLSQFPILESSLQAAGFPVWPMVEYEADDALAAGAAIYAADQRVERVIICTPDKDLAQCVRGDRVVQFDRRQRKMINADGVLQKFGVTPQSIPDYLALVGDSADGYPGLPGWGSKSAACLLYRYQHLESIPDNHRDWNVSVRGADRLAAVLEERWDHALLFRKLATLVADGPVSGTVDALSWTSPSREFASTCSFLESPELMQKAETLCSNVLRKE